MPLARLLAATLILAGCSTSSTLRPARYIADAVVVQTPDDPETAYRRASRALVEAGYPMLASDASLGTLTTDYVPACRAAGRDFSTTVQVSLLVGEDTPATVTYRALLKPSPQLAPAQVRLAQYMTGEEDLGWAELTNAAETYPDGVLAPPPPSNKTRILDC